MKKIVNISAFVLAIPIALALPFSAYGGHISPLRSVVPSLFTLLFPVLLGAALFLAILLWFLAKNASKILIASLIICAPPIFNLCPIHFFKGTPDKEKALTVMTYNVCNLDDFENPASKNTDNPTLHAILRESPDIAALQECASFTESSSASVSRHLIDSLEAVYPYRTNGVEGQALLSKYPFKELKLHFKPRHDFQVRAYCIETPIDTFTLFNLHLKSIGLNSDDKALYKDITSGHRDGAGIRQELSEIKQDLLSKLAVAFRDRAVQTELVKQLIDSVGGDVIVCGDFNDVPGCYAIRQLLGCGLNDAYSKSATGPCITFHADRFYFRIDHILYRGLKAADTRRLPLPHSDHYPLVTTFVADTD